MSDEATNARLRELHEQMQRQIADLVSGEDWARMLDVASRFHRYSFGNVCLIMGQMPTATRVGGYQTWKSLGRQVRKGEHGIRILAPCRYKTETDTGEEVWALRGFKSAAVFDVSQTDGEGEIADVRPQLLDGEAPAGLWDGLAKQVAAAGFMLGRGDCGSANGRTTWDERTVTVRDDVTEAQACKTLAHELAHVMLHASERALGCAGRKEVEAESVAFIVCQSAGMATEGYSLPYVARWANADVAVVRQTAERVLMVAGSICEALSAVEVPA